MIKFVMNLFRTASRCASNTNVRVQVPYKAQLFLVPLKKLIIAR